MIGRHRPARGVKTGLAGGGPSRGRRWAPRGSGWTGVHCGRTPLPGLPQVVAEDGDCRRERAEFSTISTGACVRLQREMQALLGYGRRRDHRSDRLEVGSCPGCRHPGLPVGSPGGAGVIDGGQADLYTSPPSVRRLRFVRPDDRRWPRGRRGAVSLYCAPAGSGPPGARAISEGT